VLRGRIVVVSEVITDYDWRQDSLWHRDIERSGREVALVRLRFASRRKDWAGDDYQRLETSVLGLARVALQRREWSVLAGMVPTILAHARRSVARYAGRYPAGCRAGDEAILGVGPGDAPAPPPSSRTGTCLLESPRIGELS
jgi:hypothetical protein